MNRSQSGPSPHMSPANQAKEDRREVLANAVECFQCRDEIEERAARQILYLIIRRVRWAYREQSSGGTRTELRDDLSAIQSSILELEEALQKDETRKALKIAGATAQELNPKLSRLKGLAGEAIDKLGLTGRQGSDRAAHSFTFHARPLLVVYLRRLSVLECLNIKPTEKNTEFLRLLSLTWELATGEPDAEGWGRHLRAANRDLMYLDSSIDPKVAISGQGPGSPATFLSAYVDAGDLVRAFNAAVSRRRAARTPNTPGAQLA